MHTKNQEVKGQLFLLFGYFLSPHDASQTKKLLLCKDLLRQLFPPLSDKQDMQPVSILCINKMSILKMKCRGEYLQNADHKKKGHRGYEYIYIYIYVV